MNIYDISKKAGVSTATVSRVLNGSSTVKPATRDKVLKVINEENYRPNAFARGLSIGSDKLVGVVCTDVSDAFFAKAVSLLQMLLREKGYTVILCCTGDDDQNKELQLGFLFEKKVDAIFLIGSSFYGDNSINLLKAAKNTPIIMINAKSTLENTYCVYCDEEKGVYEAVSRLIADGYKNILYIYDRLTPSGKAKLKGYKKALLENGIAIKDALILKTEKNIEKAKKVVAEALSSGILPDSCIASEDVLAVGALKECQNRSLNIPIIGYNNSQLCECSTPSLSSVDNKLTEMCKKGADIMETVISGNKSKQKFKLNPELILRESFKGE